MNTLRLVAIPFFALACVCCAPVSRAGDAKPDAAKIDADTEKELKAAGFTEITGSWKKIKPNIYEVTNGSLEAKRINGTLSVIVPPDAKGTLEVLVRNGHEEKNYQMMGANNMVTTVHAYTGYGVSVTDGKCDVYSPKGLGAPKTFYVPFKSTNLTLSKTDKSKIEVSVQDAQLKVHVNEKQPASANYKIDQSGPFSIIVKGTMQLESPSAKD